MMIVLIECAHISLGVFYPILGSQQFAATLKPLLQPTDKIFMEGEYANASSVRLYTGQQIYVLNGRVNGLWYGSLFPDSPPSFFGDGQFSKVWAGSTPIYLIPANEKNRKILPPFAPINLIPKPPDRYIFPNRPQFNQSLTS